MADDELTEFYTDLMNEVAAAAEARGDLTRTAFVEALVARLVGAEELQDWTPCFWDGKGHRNRAIGLDGYCFEELTLDGTIHVVIADHRDGTEVQSLATADVKVAFGRAANFVEDALAGRLRDIEPSTPAADFVGLLLASKSSIRTLKVMVVSNASVGPRYREVERDVMDGVRTELHLWDLARFHQLSKGTGREDVDIDVTAFLAGGLPALPAGIGDAGYRAYLCVVPGMFLAQIYEEFGSRLLEGNVRAFLSARGKVNKGIRKTIAKAPDRFFAYNNGITATASEIDTDTSGAIVRIRDLQIVNGGQTTASLFNARSRDKVDLQPVFVPMKLSVVSPDLAVTMIPEISEYANTQNKVSDADLFANHPFHRKVEEMSRRLWAPARPGTRHMTHWFYERARAQFQSEQGKLSKAEAKAFLLQNPKDQLITKTDLAKFENTWARLPHLVSFGAQKNFVRYAERVREAYVKEPAAFNDRWFQHIVAKAILFRTTEQVVSAASWYARAYRPQIVTYAIARMLVLIEEKFPDRVLDLDQIWKAQSVPDAVAAQVELAGKVVLDVLMSPPTAGANIGEWSKKELCWQYVSAAPVEVAKGLAAVLKPIDFERSDTRDAQTDEKEIGVVSAIVEVINRGRSGFWGRALAWPATRRVVSEIEFGILSTAARKGASFAPSDAQAKRLIAVAKRLEDAGLE
jgi:hypothetical protein